VRLSLFMNPVKLGICRLLWKTTEQNLVNQAKAQALFVLLLNSNVLASSDPLSSTRKAHITQNFHHMLHKMSKPSTFNKLFIYCSIHIVKINRPTSQKMSSK